eukprot:TRINITY_DN754_c0_g1_i1.p2 TRINITY_DN754_c0_g1~~TRINITY_DN754_c0_g1_i1.p2  ORF type:complete len:107 (+),score=34.81 TRINITY_DN754_c0_g1_i1:35-322(+)
MDHNDQQQQKPIVKKERPAIPVLEQLRSNEDKQSIAGKRHGRVFVVEDDLRKREHLAVESFIQECAKQGVGASKAQEMLMSRGLIDKPVKDEGNL